MARRAAARRPAKVKEFKFGTSALVLGAILVVAALPLCLVVTAGMAPTIVAAITDRNPKRYLLRTLAFLNLSGMVLPLAAFLHSGFTIVGAATVLLDPYKWLWMYGTAALGWLIYLGAPPIARLVVDARAAQSEVALKARAQAIIDDWGEEVTGRKRTGS